MAIDTALYDQIISNRVQVVLAAILAPFRGFSTNFTEEYEAAKKGVSMKVGLASGGTVVADPTDYEAGASNIAPITVGLSEYNVSWPVTNKELNASSVATLENSLQPNINNMGIALWDICAALMTAANYGTALTAAQNLFGSDDLKTSWASIPLVMNKHIVLDSTAYAEILPVNKDGFSLSDVGAYGFNGIHNATKWDAAETNVYGFVGGPEAMALGSKLPEVPKALANVIEEMRVITVPGIDLKLLYIRWASSKTRTEWASLSVYFGAAVAQGAAGAVIKSA